MADPNPNSPTLEPELLGASRPPNLNGGPQPKNRMPDARLALQMITSRATQLSQKWEIWAEVQKNYECRPPDDPALLQQHGLGYATNVNWGSMEARVDEIEEAYYNLASGGKTFLKFHSRAEGAQAAKMLRTVAAEHKIMWDGWNGRQEMLSMLIHNRSLFPFSAVYFDNPNGWYCNSLHPRNLIYPAGAGTNCDTWPWCAVVTSFEAWVLLKQLSAPDTAQSVGWDTKAIRDACDKFVKQGAQALSSVLGGGMINWMQVPWEQIQPHDLALNERIPAFVFYVKEWDGRVSEHILVDHQEVGYIYSKVGKHEKLSHILRLFPHSIGAGTMDSVRGYGDKSLHWHDAQNRLQNAEYDTCLVTGGLIIQSDSGQTLDKMHQFVFNLGGVTALPSGFSPAQVNFRDSAAGMRLLKQDLRAQQARTAPGLAGASEFGDYEKSQREAAMVFQQSLQLGLFKVDRFHDQMDAFAQTHWARLVQCLDSKNKGNGAEEAKAFFQLLATLGVTPELLLSIYRVTHRIGSGRGNRVNGQIGMDRARQYWGSFSEDGKRDFAKTDIELALDDDGDAEEWLATKQPGDEESTQARDAMLENSAFAGGQSVITTATDMDAVHMAVHTGFAESEQQLCEQGQRDPRQCLGTLTKALEHIPGHMQRLSEDQFFQPQLKDLGQRWSQIENYRRHLEQNLTAQAQKMQQEEQRRLQTPQVDPVDMQKLNAGQLKMAQDQQKHDQEMRIRDEEHSQKMSEGAKMPKEGSSLGIAS
jgi:hypothetical protein